MTIAKIGGSNLNREKCQEEIKFKPIQNSENKKIKFCQMFYLRTCIDCETETYRKCTECENIPLCSICELSHFHKNGIRNVTHETHDSMNESDQVVVIQ